MKKLRMEIDELVVESFVTQPAGGAGTVVGAGGIVGDGVLIGAQQTPLPCSAIDACPSAWGCTPNGTCYDATCAQADTCVKTCAATCAGTCAGTCPQSCYQPACSGPVCAG